MHCWIIGIEHTYTYALSVVSSFLFSRKTENRVTSFQFNPNYPNLDF